MAGVAGDSGQAEAALWRQPLIIASYVAAFLALDWLTYIPDISPHGIAPWNPSAGLSFAFLLRLGLASLPVLAAALSLSELVVRQLDYPWWVAFAQVAIVVLCHAAAVGILVSAETRFNRAFASMRDLLVFVLVVVGSSMVVALAGVGLLWTAGVLETEDVGSTVLRYWGGDVIGVLAVTPFLLTLRRQGGRLGLSVEGLLQGIAILLAVAIVLGDRDGLQPQFFYLLFLPIVWLSVRSGLAGVTAGLFVTQIGLMAALHARVGPIDVESLQAVLLILLFAGLAIGVLISERERAEAQMRRQQEALARAARITGMGSLTSSLAHEINQPLTAIGNYARVALRALEAPTPRLAEARDAAAKAVGQVERASEVVRKVRGLIHSGRADLAPQPVEAMLRECLGLLESELAAHNVTTSSLLGRGPLLAMADRQQMVLVLVNLIRNSLEAFALAGRRHGRIELRAFPLAGGLIAIEVADDGPGFPEGFDLVQHGPGQSEKRDGLGLGLTLSRSIMEAHGGRLSIEPSQVGATVRLVLRTVEGGRDE